MAPRHIFLAILVAALWGFNFVPVKEGLRELPPFMFVCARYLCAAFPLVFFVKRPPVPIWLILGIGLSLGFTKFALMFWGIHLGVSASLASLILQTQVFFTAILALFIYKTPVRAQQIAGMLIAFLGIFLIGTETQADANFFGFSLLIGAALAWSISNILTKKAGSIDMFPLVIWTSLVPPIPLAILSYHFEGPSAFINVWDNITWVGISSVLYTACIATWLGATLWSRLVNLYSPATVAPYSLLIPVFALASCNVFLGESLTVLDLIACGFVFLGLIINQWPKKAPAIIEVPLLEKVAA